MDQISRETVKRIKKMCEAHPDEVLKVLLETPFWPSTLVSDTMYERYEDDARLATIGVAFSQDGDAHLEVMSMDQVKIEVKSVKDPDDFTFMHRFRTWGGGGQSLRVRTALIILAFAIKIDNEENPQKRE